MGAVKWGVVVKGAAGKEPWIAVECRWMIILIIIILLLVSCIAKVLRVNRSRRCYKKNEIQNPPQPTKYMLVMMSLRARESTWLCGQCDVMRWDGTRKYRAGGGGVEVEPAGG